MSVPALKKSGSSNNITWYKAAGWFVEVVCSIPIKPASRAVVPKYHARVWRLDNGDRRIGEQTNFTYEPKTKPSSGWELPARTVTRQLRQHLATTNTEAAGGQGGEQG